MMDNSTIKSSNESFVLMTNNDSNAEDNSRAQVTNNNRIQIVNNTTGNLNNHIVPLDSPTEVEPSVSMRRCEKAVLQFPHSQMSDDKKNQKIDHLLAQNAQLEQKTVQLEHKKKQLEQENAQFEQKQAQLEREILDLMEQLGKLQVNAACEQKKATDRQNKLELLGPRQKNAACQTVRTDFSPLPSAASPPPPVEAAASPEPIKFPTPESGVQNDNDGLLHEIAKLPERGAEATVRIKYNLLLLWISNSLLSKDTTALREWARNSLPDAGINNAMHPYTILLTLSEKGTISPTNLGPLGTFMNNHVRFDCVHAIDRFMVGDYDFLHQNRQPHHPQYQTSSSNHQHLRQLPLPPSTASAPGKTRLSPARTGKVSENTFNPGSSPTRVSMPDSMPDIRKKPISESTLPGTEPPRTTRSHEVSAPGNAATRRQLKGHAPSNQNSGEGEWLCSHYKRRAYVTFDCCSDKQIKWWPCHRCHNNQSSCSRRKLKSRDATEVKCARADCNKVQNFSQYCTGCSTKFSDYFCLPCQHLTGHDDHPYHCEKCGICRIHGDRSFHCDTCGVCFDFQLRDNHKCRAGSAHDECCICLEDAFSGCQILPCSHKVHKECATQMIHAGITRCPICRESFLHKLERRPHPSKSEKR